MLRAKGKAAAIEDAETQPSPSRIRVSIKQEPGSPEGRCGQKWHDQNDAADSSSGLSDLENFDHGDPVGLVASGGNVERGGLVNRAVIIMGQISQWT